MVFHWSNPRDSYIWNWNFDCWLHLPSLFYGKRKFEVKAKLDLVVVLSISDVKKAKDDKDLPGEALYENPG
ncbi:15778_t:CDS:2, partial [Acaulospora morrowiae]